MIGRLIDDTVLGPRRNKPVNFCRLIDNKRSKTATTISPVRSPRNVKPGRPESTTFGADNAGRKNAVF